MPGLVFTTAAPVPAHPLRADIALFVGYVAAAGGGAAEDPVAIDRWEDFVERFVWQERPLNVDGSGRADTYLGAAVRSFFAAGGRKCWVVAVGTPWPVLDVRDFNRQYDLLPPAHRFSVLDRDTWRGVAHLLGLPEVSFLCLPDVPDLFAVTPPAPRPGPAPGSPELFVECGSRPADVRTARLRRLTGPRSDGAGFAEWAKFIARVGRFLWANGREVQLLAAVPRPADSVGARAAQWKTLEPIATAIRGEPAAIRIGSAFVQLAYPWLRRQNGATVPEDLEPPDGFLAGVLANSALARGAFRSAAGTRLPSLISVQPELGEDDLARTVPPGDPAGVTLRERVSVFGPAPAGSELLSDVTTDDDESYRPANINRLVSAIVRAARLAGERHVFDQNGDALWARLRDSIGAFLTDLWRDGALEGVSAAEAFTVRCDRSTMTPNDLEAGRVIVTVQFIAAAPITEINVVLSLDEGGEVSRRTSPHREAA